MKVKFLFEIIWNYDNIDYIYFFYRLLPICLVQWNNILSKLVTMEIQIDEDTNVLNFDEWPS